VGEEELKNIHDGVVKHHHHHHHRRDVGGGVKLYNGRISSAGFLGNRLRFLDETLAPFF
jgi:hypothetical protein